MTDSCQSQMVDSPWTTLSWYRRVGCIPATGFGAHLFAICSIDEGAFRAIQRKESGTRLLPAGVVKVEGVFASHQAVRIVVRRQRKLQISQVSRHESLLSLSGIDISDHVGHSHLSHPASSLDSLSERPSPDSQPGTPQPATPSLQPVLSLSSSIASLDPLTRSIPPSPAMAALTDKLSATATEGGVKLVHELSVARGEKTDLPEGDWEEVEIGKGLAQYNSVEIDRIKGMKR